jgi:GABA(A) receptor-associated protein
MYKFQSSHPFEKRLSEATKIKVKYPDRVPVIAEIENSSELPSLDKNKYLVPKDLTMGQFIYIVRKRIKIPPEKALFVFVNNKLPATSEMIGTIYEKEKLNDQFLYFLIKSETTFGH